MFKELRRHGMKASIPPTRRFASRLILLFFLVYLGTAWSQENASDLDLETLLKDENALDALIMGEGANALAAEPVPSLPEPQTAEPEQPNAPPISEPAEPGLLESQWVWENEWTFGLGYKRNVLFSAFDEEDSAFTQATLESTLFRVSSRSDLKLFGFLLLENSHFFDVSELKDEWLVAALVQASKPLAEDWKLSIGFHYTYFQQAFDLAFQEIVDQTAQDLDLGTAVIRMNQFHMLPQLEYSLGQSAFLRFEIPLSLNRFQDGRQDYEEYGIGLLAGAGFGQESRWEFGLHWDWRDYDEREQRDKLGERLAGRSLASQQYEASFSLNWNLDEAKHWRSKTSLRARRVLDNGSGYYDYWLYRVGQDLTYQKDAWSITLGASYSNYDYPVQRVSTTDREQRHRSALSLRCALERELAKNWKAIAEYRFEDYRGSQAEDVYAVQTAMLGLRFSF